jgi:hypothetical protein
MTFRRLRDGGSGANEAHHATKRPSYLTAAQHATRMLNTFLPTLSSMRGTIQGPLATSFYLVVSYDITIWGRI